MEAVNAIDEVAGAFARGLRSRRLWLALSLRDVSERVTEVGGGTLHYTAVSRIETGNRQASVGEAVVLAEALGVKLESLISSGRRESEQYSPEELRSQLENFEAQEAHVAERLEKMHADADNMQVTYNLIRRQVRVLKQMLAGEEPE